MHIFLKICSWNFMAYEVLLEENVSESKEKESNVYEITIT